MKVVLVFALLVCCVYASSHSEAPGTARSPIADISDLYAFRSYENGREDFVTILVNIYPMQNAFGGPNYFSPSTEHFYEVNIDNDGDAQPDIVLRLMNENRLAGAVGMFDVVDDSRCGTGLIFTDSINGGVELQIAPSHSVAIPLKFFDAIPDKNNAGGLNWIEYYSIQLNDMQVTEDLTTNTLFDKPFDYAGTKTFPNYASYANDFIYDIDLSDGLPGCTTPGRVFFGQRAESFAISLGKVFDLVNMVPIDGFAGQIEQCELNNDLRDVNVLTLAYELPISCVLGTSDVIGIWSTVSELVHVNGSHVPGIQVSRLGNPLVNELVIGIRDKGIFNRLPPTQDARFLEYVQYPTLPAILDILFREAVLGAGATTNLAPVVNDNKTREDLVTVFLTGIPGINALPNGTASEMLRLNLTYPAVAADQQHNLGALGNDFSGFPNGRRPGDDVVDIALRVMMGALCHPPFENAFGCDAMDAPVGTAPFIDGVPLNGEDFQEVFPYLNTPTPGATAEDPCAGIGASSSSSPPEECSASALSSFLSFLF